MNSTKRFMVMGIKWGKKKRRFGGTLWTLAHKQVIGRWNVK
jgi:hypothetical protein